MRFLTLKLRHYRVHRELALQFDPARTLIGGPNEAGKSTLVEALHRVLFLKAKGNTEHHRAMISSTHPGQPEVELTFTTGGFNYHLKKRFGPAGTTTLAPSHSVGLSGDAAETELARLLGVDAGVTGKAVNLQWAHLWVWQGQAGDDPAVHATMQQEGLLHRLQALGGAAALQSELDARVARHFSTAREQIFTQTGKPKAGSALELAERQLQSARDDFGRCADRIQQLEGAATALTSASRTLQDATGSLAELERSRAELAARRAELETWRRQETEQLHAEKEAEQQWQSRLAAHQQILAAHAEMTRLVSVVAPQQAALAVAEAHREATRERADLAEEAHQQAALATGVARLRLELATARQAELSTTEALEQLQSQAAKVAERQSAAAQLKEQLSRLAPVDAPALRNLQELDSRCAQTRVALQAMATGVEVLAADLSVQAGDQLLGVGEKQILTETTDLHVGAGVHLRLQPGGGTSLAEARRQEAAAQHQLRQTLDSLGVATIAAALETQLRRELLTQELQAAEAELKGLGAGRIGVDLAKAQMEAQAATANVERLAALSPDRPLPATADAARAWTQVLARELSEGEAAAKIAKSVAAAAVTARDQADTAWLKSQRELMDQGHQLTALRAQWELLVQTHGSDAAREDALQRAQAARITAGTVLQSTRAAIAALQPDLLTGDAQRIDRALQQKTAERDDARVRIAVAQTTLRSDGSDDPTASLALAEAHLRSATEHREVTRRQADAMILLDDLFRAEQQTLASQFTQPLADKISGYLQCLFGPGAGAQVTLHDQEFTGLQLTRARAGGGTFSFGSLSGGAREQMGAAVRLAMAEVLAADFDGCLPVLFDDAFAFSDPERVHQLQRMLDLAAARGLQVIVLTCNPTDYAALGATGIQLGTPTPATPV